MYTDTRSMMGRTLYCHAVGWALPRPPNWSNKRRQMNEPLASIKCAPGWLLSTPVKLIYVYNPALAMVKFATSAVALLLSASSILALPNAGPVSEARYEAVGQQLSFSPAPDNGDYPPEFIASAVDAFANAYTQAHNSFRAQHGARPLVWSTTLAVKAQNWANGCVFKHGSVGENLAAGTGNYGPLDAIKGWTDEISKLFCSEARK